MGANEWLSLQDIAKLLAQNLEKSIEFVDSAPTIDLNDPDIQRAHKEMIGFCIEFGYDGAKVDGAIAEPRDLGVPVQLRSVKEWFAQRDWERLLPRQ